MSSFLNKIIACLGAVLIFSSCKKEQNNQLVEADSKALIDIAYGVHKLQKMDVYLPANRTESTPVMLLIHGGSFAGGDKADFTPLAQRFAANGYAVINLNYRLVDTAGVSKMPPLHKSGEVTVLQQVEDVRAAVEYVGQHALPWVTSSGKFTIAGHSAGGTLALLYAYTSGDVRIKAVANWAGVTDFSFPDESYTAIIGPNLTEFGYRLTGYAIKNENKSRYIAISPIWTLNGTIGKPTLNILPENNNLPGVPNASRSQYDALTTVLTQTPVANKLVVVAGADHSFTKPGNLDLVINETLSFFAPFVK